MKPHFRGAVREIGRYCQGSIVKNLLRLPLGDTVFVGAFPRVTVIPLKSNDFCKIEKHTCILPKYTES